MSTENALFPQIKEEIAFDTLWQQVTETLSTFSGKLWTDNADHDPGVTLLQVVTWNVSDLSYRAALPLNDLLTQKGESTLFPTEFGPHNVLTCNTVTAEDYRCALRDLHASDTCLSGEEADFLFSDACLIREPEDSRFRWWYSPKDREYCFTRPVYAVADKDEIILRGNYWLYLLPTRYTQSLNDAELKIVEYLLAEFLTAHRNLGESVSKIIWLKPVEFNPQLTIELAEDVIDINQVAAQIYQAIEELLTPAATRRTTAQMQRAGYSNETIFEGPFLQHGWQTSAASLITDGDMMMNLSPLFNRLLAIEGVASIREFSAGTLSGHISTVSDDDWSWRVDKGFFPQLWGANPLARLASADGPLTLITTGGIRENPVVERVKAWLTAPEPVQTEPVVLSSGKLRELAAYTPVADRLPECYQLQHPRNVINDTVRELHQFLLPIDQQLADGCAELAALPQLLAFKEREKLGAIRGSRWPYAADSVNHQVHQDYANALTHFQQQDTVIFPQDGNTANFRRELSFIEYLLGYFGTSCAVRPRALEVTDFLRTQRAFLAQQPSLGYDRINIRIDQVSSLHKRIAARIGINSECFADTPDLGKLPFYIIEHRQLLPLMPDDSWTEDKPKTPTDFISVTKQGVTIKQAGSAGHIMRGQLIDLIILTSDRRQVVSQQLVISTNGDSFTFSTANSQQLYNNLDRLQTAWEEGKLRWEYSNIWLMDMDYRLNYAIKQPEASNQRRLASNVQSPYPAMAAVGDKIIIRCAGLASDWQLEAIITELSPNDGTYVIEKAPGSGNSLPDEKEAWRYQWYFSEAAYASADRFSFVVSMVFNRSINNIDAAMLREVMEEFPAHISLINHWFSDTEFSNFATTYKRWQNTGSPLGDDAYAIMQMLTLGRLPVTNLSIGLMRIATEEQKIKVTGNDGKAWNIEVIHNEELFFVPQDFAPV